MDAAHVPGELSGFRTMFSAFHRLRPDQARAVLADAVARKEGIGLFECGDRSLLTLGGLLGTPVVVLLVMPFIGPFRWSRLFWTYVVPVLPLVLLFDVIVSWLRLYSEAELRELTAGLDGYQWEIGTVRITPLPNVITYLIGVPGENVELMTWRCQSDSRPKSDIPALLKLRLAVDAIRRGALARIVGRRRSTRRASPAGSGPHECWSQGGMGGSWVR